jgi:hypothetical protein
VVSKHLPSERLFWLSFGCSCLSLVVVLVAVTLSSSPLLWFGTCAFGLFCGPLWPSLMSLLSEKHGVELQTTQLAVVFVITKLAIAVRKRSILVPSSHEKMNGTNGCLFENHLPGSGQTQRTLTKEASPCRWSRRRSA